MMCVHDQEKTKETKLEECKKEDILDFINKLIHTPLGCGKTLIELTTYNDVAMWWMADTLFCNFIINLVSKGREPERIFYESRVGNLIYSRNFNFILSIYKFIGPYLMVPYDLFIKTLSLFFCLVFRRNMLKVMQEKKPKVLFVAQDRQWKIVRDNKIKHKKYSDSFFDSIIDELEYRNIYVEGIYPIDLYPLRSLRTLIAKLRTWDLNHKPLNLYWNLNASRKEIRSLYHFKSNMNILKEDLVFKKLCTYNGTNFYNAIMAEIELYFIFLFTHLVKFIEESRTMIKSEKPDIILIINEHYWWERTLIIAAKFEAIPTLAIQHGIIHPSFKSHMYLKSDISPDGEMHSPYCPLVDKTAVFGSYYEDILTKLSAYPPNSVVVTGQPKYDSICNFNQYSKVHLALKYKINTSNRIALWAMQCQVYAEKELDSFIECVFQAIEHFNDITLIIKLHPSDSNRYFKKIDSFKRNHNVNVLMAAKSSDIFELISLCDLMITGRSTAAMEAIILNKPIIILDSIDESNKNPLVIDGVAPAVTNTEELRVVIKELLNGSRKSAINRDKFIKKYLYNTDGCATKRVVDLIQKMIKEA